MDFRTIKPRALSNSRVLASVLDTPQSVTSVLRIQIDNPPKRIRHEPQTRLSKQDKIAFDAKVTSLNRNLSLPRLKISQKESANQTSIVEDDSKSRYSRNRNVSRIMYSISPTLSEIEIKDSTVVISPLLENMSRMNTRKASSPLKAQINDLPKDNMAIIKKFDKARLMEQMKALKAIAKEVGKEPTRKKAKLCQNLLTYLSKEEGKYQEEINLLRLEIRNSVFCSSQELLNRLEAISSDILKDMSRISVPYFEIVKNLAQYLEKYEEEGLKKHMEDQQTIMKLTTEIERLKAIQKNDVQEDEQAYFEKMMQELNLSLIWKLENIKKERLESFIHLKSVIEDVESTAENPRTNDHIEHVKALMNKKVEMQRSLNEMSPGLRKLKSDYLDVLDSYKNLTIKLNITKDHVSKLDDRIKELGEEIASLSVRAAVGLKNFTPRPNLDPVKEKLEELNYL